jgi:Clr5 domain
MDPSFSVPPYSFMTKLPLAEKWNRLQPIVTRLYVDENRKLEEVIEMVRKHHGFDARWAHKASISHHVPNQTFSKHQYKYHIRRRKLKKSIPTKVKTKMFRIIEDRAAIGKSTNIEWKGRPVDKKKLTRLARDQAHKALIGGGRASHRAEMLTRPTFKMATTM